MLHCRFYVIMVGVALLGLLCSFQQAPSPASLERWNWALQQQQKDSLLRYHALLTAQWEGSGQRARAVEQHRRLLEYALGNDQFTAEEQYRLLERYRPSEAWVQAYRVQWYWGQAQTDSAYFYLGLLQAQPQAAEPLARTYAHLAEALAQAGNLRDADTYLRRAEQLVADSAFNLSLHPQQIEVYTALGRRDKALAQARAQVAYLKQQRPLDSIALALAYDQLTQRHLAEQHYYAARTSAGNALNYMADRTGQDYRLSQLWFRWAKANYHFKNKPEETALYLRRVVELLQNEPESERQEQALIHSHQLAATLWLRAEQADSAQRALARAQALQRDRKYRLAESHALEAKLYQLKGQPAAGEQALQQALRATQAQYGQKGERTAQRYLALGQHHWKQGQYSAAQKVLLEGLWALSHQPASTSALPEVADLVSTSLALSIGTVRMKALLAQYQQSRYALSRTTVSQQQAYNEVLLARWREQGTWSGLWAKASRNVHQQAVEWAWQGQESGTTTIGLAEALWHAEQARHAQFLSDVQGKAWGLQGVDSSLLAALRQQEHQLAWYQRLLWQSTLDRETGQRDWYQKQLAATIAQRTLSLEHLSRRHPRYVQWYYGTTAAPTMAALQQRLRRDQAGLIQYLETPTDLYQWVLTPDTLVLRRIAWAEYAPAILKYCRHFTNPRLRQNTRSGAFQDYCRTAHELYYRLVHQEQLADQRRWVVVPDGLLQMMPFETLLTEIPLDSIHEAKYGQLAYVLRQHRISYQPSQQQWWWAQQDTAAPPNHELLAFATSYSTTSVEKQDWYTAWRQLVTTQPYALTLMDSLETHYAGDFYTNRYATEYYLKAYASNYGILHWSLYGMAPNSPTDAVGILLMPDEESEDQLLWDEELRGLALNADLLVLTNWWTNQSAQGARQSWNRLGGSMTYAGSRALVLPLWEQDSSSVAVLDVFYKNLSKGMAKDEALRQAKLAYLRTASGMALHPNRWAGYVTLGNYQAIEVAEPVAYIWWFVLPIAFVALLGWWSLRALRQRR